MRNRFDEELQLLNAKMTDMGNLVVESIANAIDALARQDAEKAKQIVAADQEVNGMEKEIENLCLKLILEQQPVAKDLRVISAALKMVTDMERIGDHAADISEITIMLAGTTYRPDFADIRKMASQTMVMLVGCMEAFSTKDIGRARAVIHMDDKVDELFELVKKDIIRSIREEVENGEQAADLLMVAKYLERIGDHATNIAEWVIFSMTGQNS